MGPLSTSERRDLIDLLSQYQSCFASNTHELGCTDLVQMKIKLATDHWYNDLPNVIWGINNTVNDATTYKGQEEKGQFVTFCDERKDEA